MQLVDKLKGWFSETKTNLVVNLRGNLAGYDRRKGDIIRTAIFDKVDPLRVLGQVRSKLLPLR